MVFKYHMWIIIFFYFKIPSIYIKIQDKSFTEQYPSQQGQFLADRMHRTCFLNIRLSTPTQIVNKQSHVLPYLHFRDLIRRNEERKKSQVNVIHTFAFGKDFEIPHGVITKLTVR